MRYINNKGGGRVVMLRNCYSKFIVLFVISILVFLLFPIGNYAYGLDFNDDIQKVALNYYYYEGFGEDKVVQSVNDGSWHILKSDGSLINLKGNYLAYVGIEGKNLNFNDDYYCFVIGNESYQINYSSRFIYVDKNGLECFVDGYTYVDPTKGENYFILRNIKGDGNETGLYHKYNKTVVIPAVYDTLIYINDNRVIACKDDRYGLINIEQEEIIPFQYNYLTYINDNFIIAVNEDGKFGIININNDVLLDFEYDHISNAYKTNDYFKINKYNKVGLVATADVGIVIPMEYDGIEYADNELVVAFKDGQMGLIDLRNRVVVPFIYDYIMYNDDGFIVFKDELQGFLNKEGKVILPLKHVKLEVNNGFITAVITDENDEKKYAVYDINGKVIVPPIYDYIDYHATDKYILIRKGWYTYLIDKTTGEQVLENSKFPFRDVKYINDKYYAGGSQSSYAIVNYAGQMLTWESYNDISIINVNGEDLIAAKYRADDRFNIKFDYFKQTKGPSTWAVEEVSKAIESNLVPFEYQAAFTFNIKRYEFCSIIVAFLEEYYDTTKEDIIRDNNINVVNPPIIDGINDDIAICLHLGIVKGRGNGIFDGDSEITREEAAVMLANLSKYIGWLDTNTVEVDLNDKFEISSWANDAVKFVLQNNIMQGIGNGMFSPKTNLTREQIYIILYRMLDNIQIAKSDDVRLLVNKATDDGLYRGITVKTKDKSQYFSSWTNVSNPTYNPTIRIADVDDDGKDEIVILLVTSYGTGVHWEKIHILNLEDLTELNIEDPLEVINNRVSSLININNNKVNIMIKWDGNIFEKTFDASYASRWLDKISFNSIIHYEIENNRIVAKLFGQMSPAGFPVIAVLEYDVNLKVIDIKIYDNEI